MKMGFRVAIEVPSRLLRVYGPCTGKGPQLTSTKCDGDGVGERGAEEGWCWEGSLVLALKACLFRESPDISMAYDDLDLSNTIVR